MPKKTKPKAPGARQISCWASDAEGEKWNRAAKRAGMTRSKWLRQMANAAAK